MSNLGETEALLTSTTTGLKVKKQEDGWLIDWPETEIYYIGPPSIALII